MINHMIQPFFQAMGKCKLSMTLQLTRVRCPHRVAQVGTSPPAGDIPVMSVMDTPPHHQLPHQLPVTLRFPASLPFHNSAPEAVLSKAPVTTSNLLHHLSTHLRRLLGQLSSATHTNTHQLAVTVIKIP